MKKLMVILIAIAALTLNACKKLEKLTEFYLDYTASVTVPANMGINLPFDILTPDITTNYEEQFSANDTRKDMVDEIKMAGMVITVKSPQGQNLDFLKSINVFISAEGLPEKEIASKSNVPDGLSVLELDYTSDNLKEYVMKDKIKLRVKTVTDKALNQNVDLDVKARFFVNAKILGA
ncbi:MAG: hypothetical protein ACO1PI_03360 [Bacteroidota bacterium]